jgi:hypothetical protein
MMNHTCPALLSHDAIIYLQTFRRFSVKARVLDSTPLDNPAKTKQERLIYFLIIACPIPTSKNKLPLHV